MIFFLILKSERGKRPYQSVVEPALEIKRFGKHDAYLVIAWNEVFSSVEELRDRVMSVADKDPVCVEMRNQSKKVYELDPFADHKAIDELFYYWAHPLVGNLVNSPRVRPMLRAWQYLENWHECSFFDDQTRQAVLRLLTHCPPLDKASRDQCRIVYNVTELARAVIGELTAAPGRKLEKLLALKLVRSPKMLAAQREILERYLKHRTDRIQKATLRLGLEGYEYCKYYLPDDATTEEEGGHVILPEHAWELAQVMIATALGVDAKTDGCAQIEPKLLARCLRAWSSIPHVIRCTALMNDFRKLDDVRSELSKDTRPIFKLSMCTPNIGALLCSSGKADDTYAICAAAGLGHVPVFRDPGRDLTWSWNRDELHDATITYRRHLCPLWAGASGHTAGGIQFWMHVLGKEFPRSGARTITAGLFTLWRLYYDKRISGCHSLVETLEATCTSQVTKIELKKGGEKDTRIGFKPLEPLKEKEIEEDAYDLLGQCVINPGSSPLESLDPIFVLTLMRRKYCHEPQLVTGLKEKINDEREQIAKDFWMPQWSAELSLATGTEVCSFTRGLPNAIATASNPLELLQVLLPGDTTIAELVSEYAEEALATTTIRVRSTREPGLSMRTKDGEFRRLKGHEESGMWTFTTELPAGREFDFTVLMPRLDPGLLPDDDDDGRVVLDQVKNIHVKSGTTVDLDIG